MLTIRAKHIILTLITFFGIRITGAQNYLSSPYSRYGMGDIMPRTSAYNTSMGGVSCAFASPTVINFANPASYTAYDSLSCIIDVAATYKTHTLRSGIQSQKGGTAYLDYIAIGLPVTKWWRTTVGFQPYSSMCYKIASYDTIGTMGPYTASFSGDGGINEIYWGHSFRLFKNCSVGFNASFLFGKYAKMRQIEFEDEYAVNSIVASSNNIKAFNIDIGAQYFIPVKQKYHLGLGITYTPPINMISKSLNTITTYLGAIDDNPTLLDSLYQENIVRNVHHMPHKINAGISWSKEDKYFIGADFSWANWSRYAVNDISDSLVNSYKIAVGMGITPNANSSNYMARINISWGFNYEITRLNIDNQQIDKFGINIGLSFPMKKSKTNIGLILEYGQAGTLKNDLIKENYFSATVNIRLHEKWYQRLKLE
ncbi:MAG: hypothetical protein J5701_00145 [Bacteroidales bacterium]|nr:hypothetical protein [Bacteroidales bacterium]